MRNEVVPYSKIKAKLPQKGALAPYAATVIVVFDCFINGVFYDNIVQRIVDEVREDFGVSRDGYSPASGTYEAEVAYEKVEAFIARVEAELSGIAWDDEVVFCSEDGTVRAVFEDEASDVFSWLVFDEDEQKWKPRD